MDLSVDASTNWFVFELGSDGTVLLVGENEDKPWINNWRILDTQQNVVASNYTQSAATIRFW